MSEQNQEPFGYVLITGHGTRFEKVKPKCEIDFWIPLFKEVKSTHAEVKPIGIVSMSKAFDVDWDVSELCLQGVQVGDPIYAKPQL